MSDAALRDTPHYLTEAEYVALEKASPIRHEFVDGAMYAMTGTSKRHNLVAQRFTRRLADAAEGTGCRVWQESIRLRASSQRHYYPDVLVACGDEPENDTAYIEDEPCLIVEVLSPSTTATDRREKRIAYCSLPTLRHYLVVDAEKDVIEHHRRLDDETFDLLMHTPGDMIELACPAGATLDVAWLLAH